MTFGRVSRDVSEDGDRMGIKREYGENERHTRILHKYKRVSDANM